MSRKEDPLKGVEWHRGGKQAILRTYCGLHKAEPKLGEHWLWCVIQQVAAGNCTTDEALAEYGYFYKKEPQ
ncbi:hypothetical protein [Herbaspirillum sp. ST 5-3]|uniref:hypothetical protein n=1 Tax=Oxalobacteraceae TaxID=75682 RepID=UPI0010A4A870|nr:hypothetical protein [Herbaspirillum sp. ST 5-3]